MLCCLDRSRSKMEVASLVYLNCMSAVQTFTDLCIILYHNLKDQAGGHWCRGLPAWDCAHLTESQNHNALACVLPAFLPGCQAWQCWWAETVPVTYLAFPLALCWDLKLIFAFAPELATVVFERYWQIKCLISALSQPLTFVFKWKILTMMSGYTSLCWSLP